MSADQDIESIDRRLIFVEETLPGFDNRLKLLEQEHTQFRSDNAEGWRIVLELRADMQAQFAAARSEIQSQFAAVRSEMQLRFSAIELRLTALEKDVEWIRANFATRDELERAINKLAWRMYGFGTALVAAVYFIARNVH